MESRIGDAISEMIEAVTDAVTERVLAAVREASPSEQTDDSSAGLSYRDAAKL